MAAKDTLVVTIHHRARLTCGAPLSAMMNGNDQDGNGVSISPYRHPVFPKVVVNLHHRAATYREDIQFKFTNRTL